MYVSEVQIISMYRINDFLRAVWRMHSSRSHKTEPGVRHYAVDTACFLGNLTDTNLEEAKVDHWRTRKNNPIGTNLIYEPQLRVIDCQLNNHSQNLTTLSYSLEHNITDSQISQSTCPNPCLPSLLQSFWSWPSSAPHR